MKKIIINVVMILVIFAILCSAIVSCNMKKKDDDGLKTVKVADTTLT